MVSCTAVNCQNASSGIHKNSSVSFYKFPLENEPLLRQWMQNMGRDMETPSKYQCLCSEHFEESSFESNSLNVRKSRRLLKEAVPRKFILGEDGSWLVGTPQDFGVVMSNRSRKRIRVSKTWRVPQMFPQQPRLQDWQNEFHKQLLKEKYGSLMTLGKDFPAPKSQIPAGGAAWVKDPQDLDGRKTPASLSTGHAGAKIQSAGATQPHGSSQALHWPSSNQAETSGNRQNPAKPSRTRSGTGATAGRELDQQGQAEEATPWFICTECGKSFAHYGYLVRHQLGHGRTEPHACAECGRYFLNKVALHTHLRTHFHIIRVPRTFQG